MEDKKPLVVLTGPTAAGKTELSIRLAKAIGGEIISADSMQVYRHMDIGTAKIRPGEMQGVPHYLVDVLAPEEPFNVVVFKQMAQAAIEEICGRGHIPILVGGTGFYIQAVLYDIDFTENEDDPAIRRALEALAAEPMGAAVLYHRLLMTDPESAGAIHFNNVKKVIRALEFYEQTGRKISEHNKEQQQRKSPYNYVYLVLNRPREVLYDRIEQRIDRMLEAGLAEEVRGLKTMGYDRSLVSMQGLGYKELLAWLEGEISYEEAVYILKRDTRHFAKRQLTWFRRERETIWYDLQTYPDTDALLADVLRTLKEHKIITDI